MSKNTAVYTQYTTVKNSFGHKAPAAIIPRIHLIEFLTDIYKKKKAGKTCTIKRTSLF
jgi:hypothetical protein